MSEPSSAATPGRTSGAGNGEVLIVHDVAALTNLGVLARKAHALDETALLRIRSRAPGAADDPVAASGPAGIARVWATTPFGPVACRTMAVSPGRDGMVVRADAVVDATGDATSVPPADAAVPATLDLGGSADSSWPGSLPTDEGWTVLDAVPAAVLRDLERRARSVATEESGPMGLPTSLLDQRVLTVRGGGGDNEGATAEISMREVFALCALGFIPADPPESEPVRVSVKGRWRRLDGRFGSVYASEGFGVLPL